MTEDTQCETMGLQATSPPTSPLHRPMSVPTPMNTAPMLKRKHSDLVEDDDDVLMSVTTGSGVKKICVEVVCGSGVTHGVNEVNHDSVQLHHRHHHGNNSDEDLEDFSDDSDTNTSSDDDRSSNGLEDSIMVTSSNESVNCEENKENHLNVNKLSKGELDSILAKTLLNTATLSSPSPSPVGTTDNSVVTGSNPVQTTTTVNNVTEQTMPKNDNENCPKVIVEHKPLPSIYDLQQMSAACDTLDDNSTTLVNNINSNTAETVNKFSKENNDSGVSDDDDDEDCDEVSDLDGESGDDDDEEEDDIEHASPSPIFDPVLRGTPGKPLLPSPPKAIYGNGNDQFWRQNQAQAYNGNQQQQIQQQQIQQQGPTQNTFQFLDQSTQRIECAENGKSYLQLGTMNAHSHHHLPVTPVIQPKPNMVYRRPIPPFRNHMNHVSSANHNVSSTNGNPPATNAVPRPVCDHSNCLQKKNSFCYQSQRSRMLNLSLSKLHMARQSHDGSLRRSVLICNMLRYIEDETDREAMNETSQYSQHSQGAPMETNDSHHYWPPTGSNMNQPPPPSPQQPQPGQQSQHQQVQSQQVQSQQSQPIAPGMPVSGISSSIATSGISAVVTSEAPMGYNMGNPISVGAVPPGGQQQQQLNQSAMVSPNGPPVPNMEPVICPYETTLKDFNSAFRSTPYSSPAHPGSDMDSGLGDVDMDRGINWSSVLSLTSGSQSELDPLNNNTFATEAWPNTANTPTTLSGSVSTVVQQHPTTLTDISSSTVSTLHTVSRPSSPPVLSEYCTTTSSITCTTSTTNTIVNNGTSHHHFDDIGWKLSADDVLKAFPNDENLFAVAGP